MKPRPRLDRMEGHTFIGNWLTPGSIVLDCGMNEGVFASRIIERYGCRVIGVEANPFLAERNRGERGLECHNFAICGQNGTVRFRVDHTHSMNSAIVAANAEGPDIVEVPAITLAGFLDRLGLRAVDLLKLDIEGAELEVIRDTPLDVFKRMSQVAAEFHVFLDRTQRGAASHCIEQLETSGFFSFDFSMNLGNVLFVSKTARLMSMIDGAYFAMEKYGSGMRRFITQTHE